MGLTYEPTSEQRFPELRVLSQSGLTDYSQGDVEGLRYAVMRSGSEEGSFLRLVDFCITQL